MPAPSARMLTLLSLLQARSDWPGDALAQRLAVSARTVRRDVDRLRELGYRVTSFKGPAGGYRLEAGSELPPLLFDDEQAVVLAVALRTVPLAGGAFDAAAERALATVRQVMPARLRQRVDAIRVAAAPDRPVVAVDAEAVATLAAAVHDREVVRFDYGDGPPRRVEPHHVVARAGRWYLIAWDLDRDDWRLFRVDRIVPRMRTALRFGPRPMPDGTDIATFLAARFRGSASGWPCSGNAVLRVAAPVLAPFLGDADVEDLGDGACRVTAGSWSWRALAGRFAAFDAPLADVGPQELRDGLAELAERLSEASGRGGSA